jgi:hypothetical protein
MSDLALKYPPALRRFTRLNPSHQSPSLCG